jgi:hypothetical protein
MHRCVWKRQGDNPPRGEILLERLGLVIENFKERPEIIHNPGFADDDHESTEFPRRTVCSVASAR